MGNLVGIDRVWLVPKKMQGSKLMYVTWIEVLYYKDTPSAPTGLDGVEDFDP